MSLKQLSWVVLAILGTAVATTVEKVDWESNPHANKPLTIRAHPPRQHIYQNLAASANPLAAPPLVYQLPKAGQAATKFRAPGKPSLNPIHYRAQAFLPKRPSSARGNKVLLMKPMHKSASKSMHFLKNQGPEGKFVQFKLSAKRLPQKDRASKADPYVVVTYTDINNKKPILLGQTRYLLNSDNPNWSHTFSFNYEKSKYQKFQFILLDKDFHGKDELIGSVTTKVKYYLDHGEFLELPIDTVEAHKEQNGLFSTLIIQKV